MSGPEAARRPGRQAASRRGAAGSAARWLAVACVARSSDGGHRRRPSAWVLLGSRPASRSAPSWSPGRAWCRESEVLAAAGDPARHAADPGEHRPDRGPGPGHHAGPAACRSPGPGRTGWSSRCGSGLRRWLSRPGRRVRPHRRRRRGRAAGPGAARRPAASTPPRHRSPRCAAIRMSAAAAAVLGELPAWLRPTVTSVTVPGPDQVTLQLRSGVSDPVGRRRRMPRRKRKNLPSS